MRSIEWYYFQWSQV